jgi:uncharacterized lipoprotein YehR (DUF1307 family)
MKEGETMKKILTLIFAAILVFGLVACGGSEEPSTKPQGTEAQEPATEEKKEESKDDGVIDIVTKTCTMTYTKHEISKDWDGNDCLIFYFNYTNNGEETSSAMVDTFVQCFQNGIECDTAILDEDIKEADNYTKDIKPGVTLEVAIAYVLEDMSEVEIEASEAFSFDDTKDTQKITLE